MPYNNNICNGILSCLFYFFGIASICAQVTRVVVDPSMQKFVGDISQIDRTKYFNLHTNANTPMLQEFFETYNVNNCGRGFYGPGIDSKKLMGEVGVYPKSKNKPSTKPKKVRRFVATEHPRNVYKEGIDIDGFANWAVSYFKSLDESERPRWYEPMNEPFVHAKDFYDEKDWDPVAELRVKTEMCKLYKAVGDKIHAEPSLKNMKVLGYCAAWPSFELKDFGNWKVNMGLFLDIAGASMDAISYHLYDGINQVGQDNKRSGSNVLAIMDLIESYSYSNWGVIKPHAITEYGGIAVKEFSMIRNVQSIRSQNAMIFELFDREDRLEISIPFNVDDAKWHITKQNDYLPYKAVLWRPENMGVPKNEITGWVYTERIQFYNLWKAVNGHRVYGVSSNPDVQVQGFVSGKQLFVALNNLDEAPQNIALEIPGISENLNMLHVKSLTVVKNDLARYNEIKLADLPEQFSLQANETVVLAFELNKTPKINGSIQNTRYYTNKYLTPIKNREPLIFNFNNVDFTEGQASLSMSLGRKHDVSKRPLVTVNGKAVMVPLNWKGYDQKNRRVFFGTIEIPIPQELIEKDNEVKITFPDGGGYLSSLILDVEQFKSH